MEKGDFFLTKLQEDCQGQLGGPGATTMAPIKKVSFWIMERMSQMVPDFLTRAW